MSATTPPNRPATPAGMAARGAVDLAALAKAREQQRQAEERAAQRAANPDAGVSPVELVYDVDTVDFQTQVIDKSFEVAVVVDLWSSRSEQSKQLSPLLEKLVIDDAGKWVLARVDVDAQPQIAQAFQVQAIPTVVAIIKGQPVPMLQSVIPEPQLRTILDELVKVAAENGVPGLAGATAEPADDVDAGAQPIESPVDTRFDAAFDAFEAGDWDAARAAYNEVLATTPNDPDATAGLARVELMQRIDGADAASAVAAADADPSNVSAATLAADIEMMSGDYAGAFGRLVNTVRVTSGDERQAAREHLIGLFGLTTAEDPAVIKARTELANALF